MSDNKLEQPVDNAGAMSTLESHLSLLAEISQKFASSIDINKTLNTAIVEIMHSLHAEAASIFLLNADQTRLVCRACAGPIDITGLELDATSGIVGRTVADNQVYMVRDVREDKDFTVTVDKKTGFTTRSILCAPLSVQDKRLGAIELINKTTESGLFDDSDQPTLKALAAAAAMALNNAAMAAALIEEERIQHELALAREIQANLLPDRDIENSPVNGINIPIRELSGDFFDHFSLPDGRIVFNLADVSGKGINAAMLMAKTSSLFHCLGKSVTDPAQLLASINNEVFENATRGMFVTMVGGIYDPLSHEAVFANAGHQPPLIRYRDGTYKELPALSPPLGIMPDTTFATQTVSLQDASMYIFTDGLSEARAADEHQLEVSGLMQIIDKFVEIEARARIRAIIRQLDDAGWTLSDDLTLMIIERTD